MKREDVEYWRPKPPTIETKLAMVNMWFQGKRTTIFLPITYTDGKARFDVHDYNKLMKLAGIQPGQTFGFCV